MIFLKAHSHAEKTGYSNVAQLNRHSFKDGQSMANT
jgi:hypothetical protein